MAQKYNTDAAAVLLGYLGAFASSVTQKNARN